MSVRVRIAPSPTGDPHVGTAYIGLINYAFAKKNGGKFVLRIEDTDQTRCTPESAKAIYDSLKWLGLCYDEGPVHDGMGGGDRGPYVQSERVKLGIYQKYADKLLEQGDAYYCFCTARDLDAMRKRQQANNEPIMYNRRCRGGSLAEARERAAKGEPYVIRMKAPLGDLSGAQLEKGPVSFPGDGDRDPKAINELAANKLAPKLWPQFPDEMSTVAEFVYKDRLRKQPTVKAWKEIDDQVLLKSDGWPTYHLAAVVDDHLMGITHVIRAEEWLNSLPKHIWLNRQLGFKPPEYVHVGLLRNADKSKISKRKNPTSLLWYQKQGYLPEALLNFLALLGHSHPDGQEKFTLADMCGFFDLDRINVAGPVFDMAKLRHLQGQYFRDLSPERMKEEVYRAIDSKFAALLPMVKERMVFGGDFIWQTEPFYADTVTLHADDLLPKGLDKAQAKHLLEETQQAFKRYVAGENAIWDAVNLEAFIRKFIDDRTAVGTLPDATPEAQAEAKLWSPKSLFMLLRVAATGKRESPPLFDTLAQIGQAKVIERLGLAQQKLR